MPEREKKRYPFPRGRISIDFSLPEYYNSYNTQMRRVRRGTCQRGAQLLEVLSWETFENYLGVAPIRSGDSVIVKMKPGAVLL